MPTDSLQDLATEAYLYGFAPVFNLSQIQRSVTRGFGSLPASPFNQFGHADTLASPADSFVSINNDTLYSVAMIDATAGPVRLEVPDVGERYFVLQFVDAWTNNFAYVGSRATGQDGGTFLLTPPEWSGTVPDGQRRISLPTTVAVIVGRWACSGVDDLPAVAELQHQLSLAASGRADRIAHPGAHPRRARRVGLLRAGPHLDGRLPAGRGRCRRTRPASRRSACSRPPPPTSMPTPPWLRRWWPARPRPRSRSKGPPGAVAAPYPARAAGS